jgi:aconitase B
MIHEEIKELLSKNLSNKKTLKRRLNHLEGLAYSNTFIIAEISALKYAIHLIEVDRDRIKETIAHD